MIKFISLKLKLIYIFRINDEAHQGCLKIGEATSDNENIWGLDPNSKPLNEAAKKRINQYTQTAGIAYDLLYTEVAVFAQKGNIIGFSDEEVHNVLMRSGIKKKIFNTEKKANEWFVTDFETAKKAITAVKQGKDSLHPSETSKDKSPVAFRPEQKDAIERTKKQFKKSNEMLWFAKMRFGKTLSALQVAKEHQFNRTLILTHRPVVNDGWFEDFDKIFNDSPQYVYGSKTKGYQFVTLEKNHKTKKIKYVYFASMQDLRGSERVGGDFDKNDDLFNTPWDFIIVDEAHEGTQTELGKNVLKALKSANTKVLHLSGTPFNLLDDYKEDEIFTWDYVMEQRAKTDWDKTHFGDPNPYASLPKLNIFTYDLGKILRGFIDEVVAFNFVEFFRVNQNGDFLHHKSVLSFLNLICKFDTESNYPYSTTEYRDNFRHSLWMVPGVKEAKALSALLQTHPIFGQFKIVNVAGEGDDDEKEEEALAKVKKAIGGDKSHEKYTITLSCGRLTTGVSVKEWTAVFMLAGSANTSASTYMQTIFRVQTPATINGKAKEECFVFDFAPDRTLKVIAEVAKMSAKAGKTSGKDREIMSEFLNFCPIIAFDGSQMKPYDVKGMLEQLKKVYVERVVRNGFEDSYLYNNEQLMKLGKLELEEFEGLKKIIGSTKAMPKSGDIDVNKQGFTEEEYQKQETAKKKQASELTEAEKQLLAKRLEQKKTRDNAVSILRGISIRMPLLIYGADVKNEETEISIDTFADLVDNQSWEEFMPKGVTKATFRKFKKYYEPDVFSAAGKRIRALAKAADNETIEERIERITAIFATFRNPDKETVLTPWRVVNMHLGDCLGGYVFLDETRQKTIAQPQYVWQEGVTKDVFSPDSRILEINSKSGLYPLYVAYSIYRQRLAQQHPNQDPATLTVAQQQALWDLTVAENVFVICKTPMAKSITKRTLVGFRNAPVNARFFEDLINQIANKPDSFVAKVKKGKSYWNTNNNNDNMKFNAIVGNPPYQVLDGGGSGDSAKPVYNLFVDIAKAIKPDYLSMIIPAKWYSGGKGLDTFRNEMLNDKRISYLADYPDSRDCFPSVDVAGGICYFLWDKNYIGECSFESFSNGSSTQNSRNLNEYDTLVRHLEAENIIKKIQTQSKVFLSTIVFSRNPFGLTNKKLTNSTDFNDSISVFSSTGIFYVKKEEIDTNSDLISLWKVIISKTSSEHAGQTDKQGRKRVLSRIETLPPDFVCSESYLLMSVFENQEEAEKLTKYLSSKFSRFLLSTILLTQNISKGMFSFVPLQDFTTNSDLDWGQSIAEIDQQLYKKYGLSEAEVAFVERMIKPM